MLELWDRLPPSVRGTIRTLATVALNGGVATLGAVYIDPEHFSRDHLKHIAIVFGAGALAGVVNWLRQSPWKKTDDGIINSIARSIPVVLIACVLAASMSACGPKSYHTAVVANTSIAQAIFTLQDEEIAAHTANLIDDAHHAQYKAVIVKLLQAGDDLTVALREWDPAQPAPANIGLAVTQVSNLLNDLHVMTPTASKVIAAAQAVLSVLRGTGVLPMEIAHG